jgi:hypothetical protein
MIQDGIERELKKLQQQQDLYEYLCELEKILKDNHLLYLKKIKEKRERGKRKKETEVERVGNGKKGKKEKVRIPKDVAEEILSLNR